MPVEGHFSAGSQLSTRLPCELSTRIGALRHTQNSRTSLAEMPRRLQSWRSGVEVRARVPRCPAQLVHRQSVPALVARARVPPAAPPAPNDHRHVDQVLEELVAEEALAQLGQPVLSALQGAHELLLLVAQQDVVVGPLLDEGLVAVEVLAGRPQAQVEVVVLARLGQLPVRAREQRVGPRAAPQVQHDGTIRPRAARAPPSAASVICCRCLAQLAILFLRAQFFLVGRAFSPGILARKGRGE